MTRGDPMTKLELSRRTLGTGLLGTLAAGLAGCSYPSRMAAVPRDQTDRAVPAGDLRGIRYMGRDDLPIMAQDALEAVERQRAALAAAGHRGPLPPAEFLAVSGGGEDGAFGAGLLCGWTDQGSRPEFEVVTGVSTGALTAPFAYLGPRYDAKLKEVYTTITAHDVLARRGITAALFDDAMADTTPLRRFVARHADQQMMNDIAAEHARGRILMVGTTNIDARRGVIWNIGKLAASGNPRALELFQNILVASAAIPGAFPPVMIDVDVDGQHYQEMHVDGGASAQVFVYPPALVAAARALNGGRIPQRRRRVYVIRNARLDADWAQTNRRTMDIASRAIQSLIQTQGVGDLYRIYSTSQRDGVDFNLAYIPREFTTPYVEPFEPSYMNALFDLGYRMGREGYPWSKQPPNYD
jgi:predicted acylesterase/phospholipase RssA